MDITFLLIPLALAALVIWGFFWALRRGRFEDLTGSGDLGARWLVHLASDQAMGPRFIASASPGPGVGTWTALGLAALWAGLRDTGVVARNSRPIARWCVDGGIRHWYATDVTGTGLGDGQASFPHPPATRSPDCRQCDHSHRPFNPVWCHTPSSYRDPSGRSHALWARLSAGKNHKLNSISHFEQVISALIDRT
jgi:cbb3-type cytochrome oxidase maturation protein